MKDWIKLLTRREIVSRVNRNLAAALAHCPTLEAAGWSFRCGVCHVGAGTYRLGAKEGWHSHHEYQIEIVLAGRFEFESEVNQKILLRRGQSIVIPWKMAHRWKCLQPGAMLGISLELLPSPESIHKDGWLIDKVEAVFHKEVTLHTDEIMESASSPRHQTFGAKAVACRLFLLLASLMEKLFHGEDTQTSANTQSTEARGRQTVGLAATYIEEHIGGAITLAQIARKLNMSGRHLHRLFLKHVGKSLRDYTLEKRFEKARQMLLQQGPKALMKEVAFSCGFNSLAYFSHAFHKAYGISPSMLSTQDALLKQRSTTFAHAGPHEAVVAASPAKANGRTAKSFRTSERGRARKPRA